MGGMVHSSVSMVMARFTNGKVRVDNCCGNLCGKAMSSNGVYCCGNLCGKALSSNGVVSLRYSGKGMERLYGQV